MPAIETAYEHISIDEKGVPFISNTSIKVVELVVEKIAYGWSPEELHFQHPHLTLGQIYSALAYYSDNEDKLNEDIERRLKLVESLEKQRKASPLHSRLKAKRLL